MTSPIEIDERLRAIEEEHDLLQHKIGRWSAWPVLRLGVQISAAYTLKTVAMPARGVRLRHALSDVARLVRRPRVELLAKTYLSGLADADGDRFRDVWFDDALSLARKTGKIVMLNSVAFLDRLDKATMRPMMTSSAIDIATGVVARRTQEAARPASTAIAKVLQREIDPQFDDAWVHARLTAFEASRRVWRVVLKRLRPKLVLTADPGEHPLVAAATELGIGTAEIQHGFLDRFHASYSFSSYAASRREHMPVPKRMLVFGEHWKNELLCRGFWQPSDVQVVGSLRMERMRDFTRNGAGQRKIVYTSQGMEQERAADLLATALAKQPASTQLTIKLHPIYDTDPGIYRRRFANMPNCRILTGAEKPGTFDLIREADLHLSISSTCHYDALGLGVPTVILPLESHELMEDLTARGHGILAKDADHLAAIFASHPSAVDPSVSDYYFAANATQRVRDELRAHGITLDLQEKSS